MTRLSFSVSSVFSVVLFSLCCFVGPVQAQLPHFERLGFLPGGAYSYATRVSADGSVVVGYSTASHTNGVYEEAFRWTKEGGMVRMGALTTTTQSFASGISADGSVIVGMSFQGNDAEAFRWNSLGGMVGLGDLPGGSFLSEARAVSADGNVIVGHSAMTTGSEAFRWTAATGMVGLGGLTGGRNSYANGVSADGETVVGYTNFGGSSNTAFVWKAATGLTPLPHLGTTLNTYAQAISADGTTIVGRSVSASGPEAFRWTQAGGMRGLGDIAGGAFSSQANAVSADGRVVAGYGTNGNGQSEAFVWDGFSGIQNLRDVLTYFYTQNLSQVRLDSVLGISADGQTMVGVGRNPAGQTEAWVARLAISIAGKLTLPRCVNLAQAVTFTFTPTNSAPAFSRTVTLNADGTFLLYPIPRGKYTLRIVCPRRLAKSLPNIGYNGDINFLSATLLPGDANGDNSCDVLDLSALIQEFDSDANSPGWVGSADFNNDGSVDVLDLDALVSSFDLTGDP